MEGDVCSKQPGRRPRDGDECKVSLERETDLPKELLGGGEGKGQRYAKTEKVRVWARRNG